MEGECKRRGEGQVETGVMMEGVHKVEAAPPQSTVDKMKLRLKETFFPDDPFRRFKGQPPMRKWVLGAQYLFPILDWAPNYSLSFFKSDLGISYAKLANLPPIIGLCESLGLHEYICGRCRMHAKCVHLKRDYRFELRAASRVLGVGEFEGSRSRSGVHCIPNNGVDAEASGEPEYGSLSLPSAGLHRHLLRGALPSVPGDPEVRTPFDLHPHDRCTIHSVIMDVLVLARLGVIIDFLSKATLVGFMAGAAIIVSLQQLKNLLGIVHFTKKMAVVPVLSSVFHNTHEWSWQTVVMGISFLAFLLLARHAVCFLLRLSRLLLSTCP
ncbi:hypothetical protein BHE74_00052437 [Ensete ventricosum]|nr:hypothetical protein BHE74_00052437 [Ensete ventricosum]RZS22533.1 hypothetical protein BHM03_00055319 [Ensete ventricosum]